MISMIVPIFVKSNFHWSDNEMTISIIIIILVPSKSRT